MCLTCKRIKVQEFGQQNKNQDSENRRLEHLAELLTNPNDVCECVTALLFLHVNVEKIDQVILVSFK